MRCLLSTVGSLTLTTLLHPHHKHHHQRFPTLFSLFFPRLFFPFCLACFKDTYFFFPGLPYSNAASLSRIDHHRFIITHSRCHQQTRQHVKVLSFFLFFFPTCFIRLFWFSYYTCCSSFFTNASLSSLIIICFMISFFLCLSSWSCTNSIIMSHKIK